MALEMDMNTYHFSLSALISRVRRDHSSYLFDSFSLSLLAVQIYHQVLLSLSSTLHTRNPGSEHSSTKKTL